MRALERLQAVRADVQALRARSRPTLRVQGLGCRAWGAEAGCAPWNAFRLSGPMSRPCARAAGLLLGFRVQGLGCGGWVRALERLQAVRADVQALRARSRPTFRV